MKILQLIAIILLQCCRYKLSLPASSDSYRKPSFTSSNQSRLVYSPTPSTLRSRFTSVRQSHDNLNNIHKVIQNNNTDISVFLSSISHSTVLPLFNAIGPEPLNQPKLETNIKNAVEPNLSPDDQLTDPKVLPKVQKTDLLKLIFSKSNLPSTPTYKPLLENHAGSTEFHSEPHPSERKTSTVTPLNGKEFLEIELEIIVDLSNENSSKLSYSKEYQNRNLNQLPSTDPSPELTSSITHKPSGSIVNSTLFQSSTLANSNVLKKVKDMNKLLPTPQYISKDFPSKVTFSRVSEYPNNILDPKLFTIPTPPNNKFSKKVKDLYRSLTILQHHRQFQSTIPGFQSKYVPLHSSNPNRLSTRRLIQNTKLPIVKLDTTKYPNIPLKDDVLDKDPFSDIFFKESDENHLNRDISLTTASTTTTNSNNRPAPWKIRDPRLQLNSFEIVCSLDKDEGFGSDSYSSWYFNSRTETCEWFSYKGYGGNGNRFYYRANCEHSCIEKYENLCFREEIVNCVENWLHCQIESDIHCLEISEMENLNPNLYCPPKQPICVNTQKDIRKSPVYLTHRSLIPSDCYLQKDPGYCKKGSNSLLVYYYEPNINDCLGFLYSNCGGNLNRYPSKFDCMNRCAI